MRACTHTCMHVRAPVRVYILDHVSKLLLASTNSKKKLQNSSKKLFTSKIPWFIVFSTQGNKGFPRTQGGLEMDSKYFFAKLEKEIEKDWNDCGTTEQSFFFDLFESQIRLWEAAGYKKDDAVECFKNEFPEMVQYYMEEFFKNN